MTPRAARGPAVLPRVRLCAAKPMARGGPSTPANPRRPRARRAWLAARAATSSMGNSQSQLNNGSSSATTSQPSAP
eukprot:5582244-Prymnesium_polylepis.1